MVGAAVLAAAMITGGPANAASTPAATCGSGYWQIDQHDINVATVVLFYNGSTNCAVTWKKPGYAGQYTHMSVTIKTHSANTGDAGNFAYYAGPSYMPEAGGQCIEWGGSSDPGGNSWTSGWSHCN